MRLTLARKHRFVLNFTASPLVEGSTDDLHVTVHLATETGGAAAAQTALRLEVAGYAGVPIVSAGAYVNASPAGHWELLAGATGSGVYTTAVRPVGGWQTSQPIKLAMMVETVDALGATEAERRFPFDGSSVQAYAALGFSFTPFRTLAVSPAPSPQLPPPSSPPPSPPTSRHRTKCRSSTASRRAHQLIHTNQKSRPLRQMGCACT